MCPALPACGQLLGEAAWTLFLFRTVDGVWNVVATQGEMPSQNRNLFIYLAFLH